MVSRLWTWLTSIALLFGGLTNAHSHVHVCFDGRDAAVAVHPIDTLRHAHDVPTFDGDDHDADEHAHDHAHDSDHDATGHEDLDLDVPNEAVTKHFKHDSPAIVATLHCAVLGREPAAVAAPLDPDIDAAPDPRHLRPPLRGPPR